MKLIAEAKDNQSLFKMEATCSGKGWNQDGKKPCFRLWEINASDIKSRKHTDISGETDVYYGFVCPTCGCFTELENKEIPMEVKNMARKYNKYRVGAED